MPFPAGTVRAAFDSHPVAGLAVLLGISEVGYISILRLNATNGVRPVAIFLALMVLLFCCYGAAVRLVGRVQSRHKSALLIVAAGALVFRCTLLGAGLPYGPTNDGLLPAIRADLTGRSVAYERFLIFDDDIWRYLWDGHISSAGINPYSYSPDDRALDGLTSGSKVWSDIRKNVNHPDTSTIYPPLAQVVFGFSHWIAPGSVLVMKGLLTSFDLIACILVGLAMHELGRPPLQAIVYAWNPLAVKVFAGSGHVDAMMAAMLAACVYFTLRRWRGLAAIAFGAAVLAKMAPVVLFPYLSKRIGAGYSAAAIAIVAGGYLRFRDAGSHLVDGLFAFAQHWQFNAGPFLLLQFLATPFTSAPDTAARILCGLSIVTLVAWTAWRDDGRIERFASLSATVLGFSILLGPVVMPWYMAAILPLAAIAGERLWVWYSAVALLAFLVMIDGTERTWALLLEYGLFALALRTWFRERQPIIHLKEKHSETTA